MLFRSIGSSFFANYLPYYYLNQSGIHAEMREAGEFLFHSFPLTSKNFFRNTFVILTSQSGESGEIVKLLERFKRIKAKPFLIGITNTPKSSLDEQSDITFFTKAGKEETVTSKTYSASLIVLNILAKIISNRKNLNPEQSKAAQLPEQNMTAFKNLHINAKKLFEKHDSPEKVPNSLSRFMENNNFENSSLIFLARGTSLATAYQSALNAKELAKINSEAQSVSTFNHGGIECLTEDSNLIFFSSDENSFKLNNHFIQRILMKMACNKILHITNQELDKSYKRLKATYSTKLFTFKHTIDNPFLAPIMEIFPIQILLYKIAQTRGIEPGKFYYSQKITRNI